MRKFLDIIYYQYLSRNGSSYGIYEIALKELKK